MSKVSLLVNTLRYLKPAQVFARLWNKVPRGGVSARGPKAADGIRPMTAFPGYYRSWDGGDTFTFLDETHRVARASDWGDPSFQGNFLPSHREVSDNGFKADWKVMALNREYGQIATGTSYWGTLMSGSELGVKLCIPVDQYQQTTRTVKYAILIIWSWHKYTHSRTVSIEVQREERCSKRSCNSRSVC